MKTTNDIKQSLINEIIENCITGGNKDFGTLQNMPIAALEFILESSKKYIFDRKQE